MTTKSKSPLFIIIAIAVLLFISAIIWKNTRVDNSEEIYVAPILVEKPIIKKERKIILDTYDLQHESSETQDTTAIMKKKIKVLETTLNMNLMLKKPEDVVKAIDYYELQGNDAKVQLHIDFLAEKFPDFAY